MGQEVVGKNAVLVVEDDPAIRRLVRMVLERSGYAVDVAVDGGEAASKLGAAEFDVIILDLMMPNIDGFSLLKSLAETTPDRLRRIIVTSAASPSLIQERLIESPFAMLSKPFDIDQLAHRVRSCLDAQN